MVVACTCEGRKGGQEQAAQAPCTSTKGVQTNVPLLLCLCSKRTQAVAPSAPQQMTRIFNTHRKPVRTANPSATVTTHPPIHPPAPAVPGAPSLGPSPGGGGGKGPWWEGPGGSEGPAGIAPEGAATSPPERPAGPWRPLMRTASRLLPAGCRNGNGVCRQLMRNKDSSQLCVGFILKCHHAHNGV